MLTWVYERFTDPAREVVVLAQDVARDLKHDGVDTGHVLLGLIAEREGLAARALETAGMDLEATYRYVERLAPVGEGREFGQILMTVRAARVIDLAHQSAERRGMTFVGTEHLLLGLVGLLLEDPDDDVAFGALCEQQVSPEQLREQIDLWVPVGNGGLSWMLTQHQQSFQIRSIKGAGFQDVLSLLPDSGVRRLFGRAVTVAAAKDRSEIELQDLLDAFDQLPDGAELLEESGVKAATIIRTRIRADEREPSRFDASESVLAVVTGAERLAMVNQQQSVTVRYLLITLADEQPDLLTDRGWEISGS